MGLRTALGLKRKAKELTLSATSDPYWQDRKDFRYLDEVKKIAAKRGGRAKSIVDVGSFGCPYLEWFDWIPTRVSVDIFKPYEAPSIESIKSDFFAWQPRQTFDLVLCLQVLEHIDDAAAFARKLLRTGRTVIASVPYRWPKGACEYHVQDPVDEAKMREWFGIDPIKSTVATEADNSDCSKRLICVYRGNENWLRPVSMLKQRLMAR